MIEVVQFKKTGEEGTGRRESRYIKVGANQEYTVHKNNWTSVSIRERFLGNADTHPHTPNPFRSVQRWQLPARGPLSFQRMILQGVISVPLQQPVMCALAWCCMLMSVNAWCVCRSRSVCQHDCTQKPKGSDVCGCVWSVDFTKMMQQEYIKKVWQLQSMGWIWWCRIYRNCPALKIQSLHKWPLYMKYW